MLVGKLNDIVQYAVGDGDIALCVGFFDVPSSAVTDTVLAFAADSIDPADGSGWSVQVQGTGRVDGSLRAGLDCGDVAGGMIVRLVPVIMSGYRLQLCPIATALPS